MVRNNPGKQPQGMYRARKEQADCPTRPYRPAHSVSGRYSDTLADWTPHSFKPAVLAGSIPGHGQGSGERSRRTHGVGEVRDHGAGMPVALLRKKGQRRAKFSTGHNCSLSNALRDEAKAKFSESLARSKRTSFFLVRRGRSVLEREDIFSQMQRSCTAAGPASSSTNRTKFGRRRMKRKVR